jgi:Glutathione S-transferase, N-terminal domain/Putative lumazine-binding
MMGQIEPLGFKTYFPIQNFIDMVAQKPGMAGPNYKYYVRNIDLSNDAGVAVLVETDYLGCDFVDYFSVAKIDGRWWITNKTYTCTGLSPKPKIIYGYWKIRGLGSPIKYLLEYLGVPYEEKLYDYGDGPEFNTDSWNKEKFNLGMDFPNLPYLIDGDLKISESSAILRYIANQYGESINFSGKTLEDKAYIDMVYGVVADIKLASVTQ